MGNNTLVVDNISKIINSKEIVKNISLELHGGNIYGFSGENGSGKTMFFRIASGLVRPTRGVVLLNGQNVHKRIGNLKIGVIIENSEMWPNMTARENLFYLSKLNRRLTLTDIDATLNRVGLDPENRLPVKKYSLGMKQRLSIAQAIMEKPDFLFLDEPTNAIDQDGVAIVRRIIIEEANRGAVVLIASHISQDISSLCAEVYDVKAGVIQKRRGGKNE